MSLSVIPPSSSRRCAAPLELTRAEGRRVYAQYMPIVRRIAMRTVRSLPSTIAFDDVLSAGWVGMVESLGRRTGDMDDEHFEAYASYRIRGAILDYLRQLDPMSRKLRGASRRLTSAVSELIGRLGRVPMEEEIAAQLGLPLAEYHALLNDLADSGLAHVDLSECREPIAAEPSPEVNALRRELVTGVASAIERLPARLQLVLGLYYQEECSFREIGEVLGVTESRVCQLHSEAVHMLRALVAGQTPRKARRRRRSAPCERPPKVESA